MFFVIGIGVYGCDSPFLLGMMDVLMEKKSDCLSEEQSLFFKQDIAQMHGRLGYYERGRGLEEDLADVFNRITFEGGRVKMNSWLTANSLIFGEIQQELQFIDDLTVLKIWECISGLELSVELRD